MSQGVKQTDKSGTITLGGTAQVAMVANGARNGLFLQNASSGDLWVSFDTTAVVDSPSVKVPAGASLRASNSQCPSGAMSIIGATTGQKFTLKEY
jgi:hypothetical protein